MTTADWATSRLSDVMHAFEEAVRACAGDTLLVLCDPALGDPAQAWRDSGLDVPPPKIVDCRIQRSNAPYVLILPQSHAGERLLQATLESALAEAERAAKQLPAPRSVCAWIQLDTGQLDRFLSRLARRARRPVFPPDELGVFRFWDPRVFIHLPRIFGAGFAGWFDVRLDWRWIDGRGEMRYRSFLPAEGLEAPPALDDSAVLQTVENLAYINPALVHTGLILQGDESEFGARLEPYVRHARTIGCTEERDVTMYAATALELGGPFEQTPSLQPFMASFVAGQIPFGMAATGVPDESWAQAKRELASAGDIRQGSYRP